MPSSTFAPSSKPLSGRYLAFAEREEIALALAQDFGVREIARRLGRAASTVSRELRRNAATRSGGLEYRASTAQWHAERSARRPKRAKLAINAALRAYVQDRLAGQVVAQDGAAVRGRSCRGRDAGMGRDRSGDGVWRGAPSRLRSVCGTTFLAMRRCRSATRRSTRRYMCKAAAGFGAS